MMITTPVLDFTLAEFATARAQLHNTYKNEDVSNPTSVLSGKVSVNANSKPAAMECLFVHSSGGVVDIGGDPPEAVMF